MQQTIDSIQINFNPEQLFILNLCLAFIMFGVALDLRFENFRALIRSPRAPLVGLSSQLILLPILTLGLVFLFRPAPSIALGMILIAACPGGNVSNFAVHLANANAALSVLMTSVSTLAAIMVTPLYFTYLAPFVPGAESLRENIYVDPADMAGTIVQLILVPLFIGMFLHYRFPEVTGKLKRPVRVLSMAIFLGFVVFAVYGNFENIVNYLHIVFLIVLVHNSLALLTGYLWAKGNGLSRQDARAISIETGIQNSGLGLILIFNFFHGLGGMAMIAAWWGVWHLLSAFGLAMVWRERSVLSVD
ncbi:MAG: bile acid:sodium symporter family protein [Phaeodactylibacter sp.]|nr:bile acid:sodium symporter family protein [Phaeodactylibacter sp.]MCB9049429.1 bile acid:sodium symporter family protein [Lewinellaceae bacterium]